ncbi:MAG: hypothetical protein ACPGVD_05260, partial [Flavobacteriales bacterium]
MAKYYYDNGDYEKAKLYYEKIFKPNSSSAVYNEYINTLVELNDFKQAEKITKKKIKSEKFGAFYKIKL